MLYSYRMLNNSIASVEATDPHLILRNSLQRTAACYSLDTTMARQISIDKMVMNKDPRLKNELEEIGFEKCEEHLQGYYERGLQELTELTEYYKYYTQSSILYQPAFFKMMHCYREHRKAMEYNRLKCMLELSNSTQYESSVVGGRLQNTPASSFRFLSLLKLTSPNEESLLLQNLKEKLQSDYGPNKYNSLEEIDRQYCFSKPIERSNTAQRIYTRGSSKKSTKHTNERSTLFFKNKTNIFRSSSTALSGANSTRKVSKSRINHRKHGSMDNFVSLGRQNHTKTIQSQGRPASREAQVKRKILGVKEQIRREKQLLVRRTQSNKGKKTTLLHAKIGRKMRQ